MSMGRDDGMPTNSTAFSQLQMAPPVPIEHSNWESGWAGPPPPGASALRQARQLALGKLFATVNAQASELEEAAVTLMRYASLLRRCCARQNRTTQHCRVFPMVFAWAFPAETVAIVATPDYRNPRVAMRSAYPAFEFVCVSVASAILFGRAGMSHHNEGGGLPCQRMAAAFRSAVRCLDLLSSALPGDTDTDTVFGVAQWARLRRQQLPLQLQSAWHRAFHISLCHRYHLCCSIGELVPAPGSVADAIATKQRRAVLRGSEDGALMLVQAARWCLVDEPHLSATQLVYCQDTYEAALKHMLQLRAHGCVEDAELALEGGLPHFAHALLQVGHRTWSAFSGASDTAALDQLVARHKATEAVLQACPVLQEPDEGAALQWRSELPVVRRRL